MSKILIVEDSQVTIDALSRMLEPDYSLVVAQSGIEALKKVRAEYPDLILLDIILPGMDGYQVIEELKKNELTSLIPVIFITSMADTDAEVKGFSLGAVDYIIKPFKKAVVRARIAMHLKSAEQMRINERLMMMLDTSPMCNELWDENYNKIECNEAAVKMFGYTNKQDFLASKNNIYPEFQPDGVKSLEKLKFMLNKAFDDSAPVMFDWTYKLTDGTLLPTEVVLIRVRHEGNYAVAVYTRDLREQARKIEGLFATTNRLRAAMQEAQEANRQKNYSISTLEKILNSIDAAIYVTVPETGELLFVNDWLKKLYNIKGDEALGQFCYQVFRQGREKICDFCPCDKLDNAPSQTVVWDEYMADTGMHVRHADCYVDWPDGRNVHLQYSLDVTTLVEAMEQVQHISNAKSDFLSNMSHEIRTPLNSIIGFTQIIGLCKLPPEIKEPLAEIDVASRQLLQMVEDVFDAVEVEYGGFKLDECAFNFKKLLGDLMQRQNRQFAKKRHSFKVDIAPVIPETLVGDEKRLTQIIASILAHAVKVTPENGAISLTAGVQAENDKMMTLQVVVTDTGAGVEEDEQTRIFSMFNQVDKRPDTLAGEQANRPGNQIGRHDCNDLASRLPEKHDSIRLGLALSKRIANMMGGDITVESKRGTGSKFTFTCRLRKAQ